MFQVLTYAAQPFEMLTQTVTSYTSFECEWYVREFNAIFVVLKECEVTFQYFLQQQQQIPMQQVHHVNQPPQPGQILNAANIAQEKE